MTPAERAEVESLLDNSLDRIATLARLACLRTSDKVDLVLSIEYEFGVCRRALVLLAGK